MYHGLARGHATAFLNNLQAQTTIQDWFGGPSCETALMSFKKSCRSKKPGRIKKRLLPLLKPAFIDPYVLLWEQHNRIVIAQALGSGLESQMFDLSCDDAPLFNERSVFLNLLGFHYVRGECNAQISRLANISHHAITRLLERRLCTPESLRSEVGIILHLVSQMVMVIRKTTLDRTKPYTFMVPYREGALPVVIMKVRTARAGQEANHHIISVRTYLGSEMISDTDAKRMEGFQEIVDDFGKTEDIPERMVKWMQVNARPWTAKVAAQILNTSA